MQSPFHKFWNLGYTKLVPIIPPDAELSERSTLFKKLEQGKDARGKAVGVRNSAGKWHGLDWLNHTTTEADLEDWTLMGAGVGVRTGNGILALDIDSLDESHSSDAQTLANDMLGPAPIRIGRFPKRLMVYRTADAIPYQRVEFVGHDGNTERVELLSDGRQFVAAGVHPTTGSPYRWLGDPKPVEALTTVTAAQIDAYFSELARRLPAAVKATGPATTADRSHINQDGLTADLEKVAAAVAALPNTRALFPTYDDYIRVGAAIKGATQNNPQFGLQLFQQWADRYELGSNDPETAEADYSRIKPPYELGARWLFDKAAEYGSFPVENVWFDEIQEEPKSPYADLFREEPTHQTVEPFRLIAPDEWEGIDPAPREWEVEGWIPKGEVTLLYGDGGIGKTLVAQQYATAAAAGIDWLGQPTRQAKVLCYLCEDAEDELHRRQNDINAALCLSNADIAANLRYAPRKFQDNVFALWDRQTGAMRLTPTFHQLRAAAMEFKASVVIIDTIADVFAGSEIDRVQVNSFVKTCLGKLAQDINGTVIALGHPSVSGKSSGSGTSGSTAWNNAVRSRLYLDYPKGTDRGDFRELKGMKSNYGPRGNLIKLKWNKGAFDVVAATVAPTNNGTSSFSDSVDRATLIPTVNALIEDHIKAAVKLVPGVKISCNRKSAIYHAKVLQARYEPLQNAYDVAEIATTLEHMIAAGQVQLKDETLGLVQIGPALFT